MIVFCVAALGAEPAEAAQPEVDTTGPATGEVDATEGEDTAGTGYGGPVELTATGECSCAHPRVGGTMSALVLGLALALSRRRRP